MTPCYVSGRNSYTRGPLADTKALISERPYEFKFDVESQPFRFFAALSG